MQRRFGGSRDAVRRRLAARGRQHRRLALGAIADELRREALLLRLRATTPSAAEVAEFAVTYASVPLRDIPGTGALTGVDPATPLGLLSYELARPAIVRALQHVARAERYASWAEQQQERALNRDSLRPRPPADGRDGAAHELDAVPGASRGNRRRRLDRDDRSLARALGAVERLVGPLEERDRVVVRAQLGDARGEVQPARLGDRTVPRSPAPAACRADRRP